MSLLKTLFRRKNEEQVIYNQEVVNNNEKPIEIGYIKPSLAEKYPEGLPLNVLQIIDYKKFGAMLKKEQLLPPSYDRNPIKVEIDEKFGGPRVILTFKSETSDSERVVSIYGYTVAYSSKINTPITILEVNNFMSEVWREFAEHVMWSWDRGYRYSLIEQERKGDDPTSYHIDKNAIKKLQDIELRKSIAKNLMQEDMEYIQSVKEIAKMNKRADEYALD